MKKLIKKIMRMAVCVCGVCLLISGTALAAEQVDGHGINPFQAAMVAKKQATVRTGPAVSYPVLGTLQTGQVVNACGQADTGWYQVVYGNGIGYVSNKLLTQVPVDDAMAAALALQAAQVKQMAAQAAQEEALQEAVQQAANALAEQQEAAAQNAALLEPQNGAQNPAVWEQQQILPGTGNVIFAGDSRTGQMCNAVGGPAAYPGVAFAYCFGGGNEWLSTPQAKKEIDQYVTPGSVIILNYGVNDLSKHNEYIATINQYNRDWRSKGAVVYFASVGPVGENEYGKRNWAVEYFNNQLNGRLDGSIGRIDLYSYLVLTGYTPTADGMHYTPDTYARMFQFLMQSVEKM